MCHGSAFVEALMDARRMGLSLFKSLLRVWDGESAKLKLLQRQFTPGSSNCNPHSVPTHAQKGTSPEQKVFVGPFVPFFPFDCILMRATLQHGTDS